MCTNEHGVGKISTTKEKKRILAEKSKSFICKKCVYSYEKYKNKFGDMSEIGNRVKKTEIKNETAHQNP